MCIILDANRYGDFLNPKNQAMQPVRDWLEKSGKLVYSPTKKLKTELERCGKMKNRFDEYGRAGKLKIIDKSKVNDCESKLIGFKSDDGHIIALAQAANVKVLVSEDKKLRKDFTNAKFISGGKVYRKAKHKDILNKDTCP